MWWKIYQLLASAHWNVCYFADNWCIHIFKKIDVPFNSAPDNENSDKKFWLFFLEPVVYVYCVIDICHWSLVSRWTQIMLLYAEKEFLLKRHENVIVIDKT